MFSNYSRPKDRERKINQGLKQQQKKNVSQVFANQAWSGIWVSKIMGIGSVCLLSWCLGGIFKECSFWGEEWSRRKLPSPSPEHKQAASSVWGLPRAAACVRPPCPRFLPSCLFSSPLSWRWGKTALRIGMTLWLHVSHCLLLLWHSHGFRC